MGTTNATEIDNFIKADSIELSQLDDIKILIVDDCQQKQTTS